MRNHPPALAFVTRPAWGPALCQGVQSSTGLGPRPAVNLGCNSALLGLGMEIPHLPHLGQHPPGRPPHLLPCSSSSPRAWAGFCWHSLRRGPRGQEQYPGEAPPEPDRVRYLQPQPGQRLCSALGHSSGAGPGKTCHLPEPVVCPSYILAPCQESRAIPAPTEVHTHQHLSHELFKEQGARQALFTSCLCRFEGVHDRPRVSISAGTEPHHPFNTVPSSVTWWNVTSNGLWLWQWWGDGPCVCPSQQRHRLSHLAGRQSSDLVNG